MRLLLLWMPRGISLLMRNQAATFGLGPLDLHRACKGVDLRLDAASGDVLDISEAWQSCTSW